LTRSFTLVLILLTAGIASRPWFGFNAMLALSVLVTLGIAISNVLFPAMIRVEFPTNIARMTAVYTTLLAVFAAAAAVFAVPLDKALGGWQASLAAWAVPGVLAVIAWLMTAKQVEQAHPTLSQVAAGGDKHVWLHPITWSLVGFFGLQSMNFYCMLNWFPAILQSKGFSQADAGNLLGLVTIVGVPAGLLITANLAKFKSLPLVAVLISLVTSAGIFLMYGPASVTVIGGLIAGLGLACSFPLSLALIALKAHDQKQTTLLSAVSQGFGYLIAALGTFAMGYSFSLTGGWEAGLAIVGGAGLIQAAVGWYAAGKHTL
jgi:CP family cyanate transporter-like MFS transporter